MLIAPAVRCSDQKPVVKQMCIRPSCVGSEYRSSESAAQPPVGTHFPSRSASEASLEQVDSSSHLRQRAAADAMQSERSAEAESQAIWTGAQVEVERADEGLSIWILAPVLAGSCAALTVLLVVAIRRFRRNLRGRVHAYLAADTKPTRASESLAAFTAQQQGKACRFPPKVATYTATLSATRTDIAADVLMCEADPDEDIDLSWFRQERLRNCGWRSDSSEHLCS